MRRILFAVCLVLLFSQSVQSAFFGGIQKETATYSRLTTITNAQQKVIDKQIWNIKYSTGVTLASVALNMSTVVGTEFITNPKVLGADYDLRWIAPGWKVSAYDGAKTAYAIKLGNGTGETYGSDVLAGFDFDTGWTLINCTALNNVLTLTSTFGYASKALLSTGKLYKGTLAATITGTNLLQKDDLDAVTYLTRGTVNSYFTAVNNSALLKQTGVNTNTFTVTTWTNQQVLTPSDKGITLNAWTKEAGFAENAAAHALTVTRN